MSKQENTKRKEVSNWKLWTVVVVTVGIFLGFSVYFVYFYFQYIGLEELTKSDSTFGTFGDYLGGTVGTITAIAVFIATLIIIFLQKEELKATRDELEKSRTAQELQAKLFQQQQFETTFFTLLDKMNNCTRPENLMHFCLLLKLVYNNIKDYSIKYNNNSNNNKEICENIENKYRDILKSYLDNVLHMIFCTKKELDYYLGSKSEVIFNDTKIIAEEYFLFENLYISFESVTKDEEYRNSIIERLKMYDIRAYKNNDVAINLYKMYILNETQIITND